MSVIIRLQNLPWNANAIDIRHFFHGLSIPDGGVHIVGGDKGDAFIAFSTDEDARLAMQKDGGRIHSSQVKLLLSSKTEMQNVIAAAKAAGPPPVQQVSSSGIKEAGFYDRPAVPPVSFQGGDNYRDRPRDYPNMPLGPSARVPEERFPGRGQGEPASGASLPGGMPLGSAPYQQPSLDGSRQIPGALSRTSYAGDMSGFHQPQLLDDRQISGAMMRPSHGGDMSGPGRLPFGEVGPGPTRVPDLHYQNEQAVEDRRRYVELEPSKFVDEKVPVFQGAGNLGPGSRDYYRSNVDMVSDKRDFGPPNNGKNFGRPSIPEDTRRPVMTRYDADRPLPDGRNLGVPDDMRSNNRPERGFFEGPNYLRNTVPSDYVRYEEPVQVDEREMRRDGSGRTGSIAAPGVGRSAFGPKDGFEVNRQALIPENPGSRFSHEPRLQDRNSGPVSKHIQDLRDVDTSNGKFENQYPRSRDNFHEEIPPPKRLRLDDQRNAVRPETSRAPFNDFPNGRSSANKEHEHPRREEWPMGRREVSNTKTSEKSEDPREQLTFRCSNLPRTYNYKEVRRFFTKCEIPREGLKLVNDKSGNRSGTAYVMFMNNRGAMTALGMNGKMAMDCKVRIERCSFSEYENVVDSQIGLPHRRSRSPMDSRNVSNEVPGVFYFVVKKLPPKAERADVKKFFGRFRIAADGGPFMELSPSGTSLTGNALVSIEKLRNASDVITTLHRSPIQGTKVDVINVNKVEYEQRTKRSRHAEDPKSKEKKDIKQDMKPKDIPVAKIGVSDAGKQSHCIYIRGVPFSANAAMVKDFFRGLDIAPNGIRIVINGKGRATGDAYVEFTNAFDQRKAMEMDKKYMGHRYVELSTISRQAMISELHSKQIQCDGPPVEGVPNRDPLDEHENNHLCAVHNLHPNTQLEDILDFFRGYRPIVDSIKLQYKDGQPTGDGLVAFPTSQEAESAVRAKDQHFLLGRLITLSIWSKK